MYFQPPPNYEKVVLDIPSVYLNVCMYSWMDVRLVSAWIVEQILIIFDTREFILLGLCPANLDVPAPKMRAHHMVPKAQNNNILKNINNFE
jgi:hypothetical protein